MRRTLSTAALLTGLLLIPARSARADRLWALQLRSGTIVLSLDAPEERGTALVFHRHPDALFSSLRSDEVRRITIAEGPGKKPRKSLDGEILVFGRDAEPPQKSRTARLSRPAGDFDGTYSESDEPSYDIAVGAGGPVRLRRHAHLRIGRNGLAGGFAVRVRP